MPPLQALSLEYVEASIADGLSLFECADIHPGLTCNEKAVTMFLRCVKPVTKAYIPIHVLPLLLFKRKQFVQKYPLSPLSPVGELLKLILGIVRSVLFGAGYYSSYKWIKCHLLAKTPMTPSIPPLSQLFSRSWRPYRVSPSCSKTGADRQKSRSSQSTRRWRRCTTWGGGGSGLSAFPAATA